MRTLEHKQALEKVVLGQFSPKKPCDRKENRPPGAAALAERAKLLGPAGAEPKVDLDELAKVIYAAFPGADGGDRVSEASTYQALRGHLAALRLAAAAEALPGLLDKAKAEGWSTTVLLEALFRLEAEAAVARRHATLARLACLPAALEDRRLRLRGPALGRQKAHVGTGDAAVSWTTPPTFCSSGRQV